MPQGALPYKYEEEKSNSNMTSLAGLPVYLDLASVLGLGDHIRAHMHVRQSQGWTDEQIILSLVLLNLAGGDSVDDIRILDKDEGFCRVLGRVETKGLSRQQRRARERRWRKKQHRSVPSPSAIFRYLEAFHDPLEEKKREKGTAFIPAPNQHVQGLVRVNRDLVASIQKHRPKTEATLDGDATLAQTQKEEALFSYKGYRAYQPFNTWWAEQELVLHTEFRDGNVPAGYEQLRVFKEALDLLPEGVEKVYLRSDTAGYQHDLLKYCEQGKNKRFGRIEFAIGADVTKEFKKAVAEVEDSDWRPVTKEIEGKMVATGKEWAEVCFVPAAICHSKKDPVYRYIATRELLAQPELPGMEGQITLPFQTLTMEKKRYKIFGIVTNRDTEGSQLVNWLHKRCGKSEEAHAIMKEDLAGGRLPSGDFGENAAWWWIMILAFNLNAAMKQLALGGSWVTKRMKALRFALINLPGRVLDHARELAVRLVKGHPSLEVLLAARQRIMELGHASG
jgi:hypothetical protein